LFSINASHSFHSLLTLFSVSPLFATLTKSTPGVPPPANISAEKLRFSHAAISRNRCFIYIATGVLVAVATASSVRVCAQDVLASPDRRWTAQWITAASVPERDAVLTFSKVD
jgi:hypothetical protein